jgi:hypothetical protein
MNRFNIILLAGLLFCICARLEEKQPANVQSSAPEKLEIRNNVASLLYDLLGYGKNVGKILIIKRNSEELGQLIKAISKASVDGEKQMEQVAKNSSGLNLRAIQLPQGEKATRDAVAKTKEHELLFSSREEFEFNLLLTQAEALSYGWHLAKIAVDNFFVTGGNSNIYRDETGNGKFMRPGRLANAAKQIK